MKETFPPLGIAYLGLEIFSDNIKLSLFMNLEEYLIANNPWEYYAWKRFSSEKFEFTHTDKFLSLRGGYGGFAGVLLSFYKNEQKYILLKHIRDQFSDSNSYVLYENDDREGHWTRSMYRFKDYAEYETYLKSCYRDRHKWELQVFGKHVS
jgi:hypothetical protein